MDVGKLVSVQLADGEFIKAVYLAPQLGGAPSPRWGP